MSEFERLGPEAFWQKYAEQIDEIDRRLVMPALKELRTVMYLRADFVKRHGNMFQVLIRELGTFEVSVDVAKPGGPFCVGVTQRLLKERKFIGSVCIQMPRNRWSERKNAFKKLFVPQL